MLRHTYKCFLYKSSQQHQNWVNQLKQGTVTEPFVFVIGYNLESKSTSLAPGNKTNKEYK